MTGGPDGDEEQSSHDSRSARLLMVAVLALAVASTAVLVLTDSAKWLRLGVLAALWAALLGVFLASRFRKAVVERDNQVADLQSVYELELEREVAARREYELEVEAEARKRVEEANREDLAELRNELRILRESLDRLNGGEVLVERFALRAQSTRMRTLSEGQARVVASGEDSARMRRSIMAGNQPTVVDAQSTELIPRADLPAAQARREPQRRESQRPAGYRPEPSRPQTPRDGVPADDGERQRREPQTTQSVAAQPTRVARPVPRPQPTQLQPAQQAARPGAQRPAQQQSGPLPHPAAQTQQQVWPGQPQPQRSPSQRMPRPTAQRPVQGQQRRPQRVEPTARQQVRPDSEPTVQSSLRDIGPVPEPGDVGLSARLDGRPAPRRAEPARAEPARAEPPRVQPSRTEPPRAAPPRAEPPNVEPPPRPEPVRPEPRARVESARPTRAEPEPKRAESTGGHRRAVEEPAAERSRHRVDDAPRDWQSYREWRQESTQESGHHAKVDPPASTVWREDDPETTGAHTAGKSVTELLAAHGQEDAPRRHRRRAE
jgi:hypothetical protein